MAAPLTIKFIQDRAFEFRDTLRLEVNGTALPNIIRVWGPERSRMTATTPSLGYGRGAYGRGGYGVGARILQYVTPQRFVAGDYSLRDRAVDALGNIGAWSGTYTHQHRPVPPAPKALSLSAGVLTWLWTDP